MPEASKIVPITGSIDAIHTEWVEHNNEFAPFGTGELLAGLRKDVSRNPQLHLSRIREETFRSLSKQWINTPLENIQVWHVQDDVYAIQASVAGVTSFQKANGEIILNPWKEAQSPFIKNYDNPDLNDGRWIREAGYVERKEGGVWNLYQFLGTDQKGGLALGRKIDPKSPEYFNAWRDILFYSDVIHVLYVMKKRMDTPETGVGNLVRAGSVKFETLELLLKKWLITKESFDYGVAEMRKVIVSQCRDTRFDWFNAEVEMKGVPELRGLWTRIRESDLKRYYEKGYIDSELVRECFAVLPMRLRDVTGAEKE